MNRINTIDSIRGFALLGILIFNVQTYSLFAFLRPEQVYDLGLDYPQHYIPLQFLVHLLIKGQFYTIYSFLFGLGFYLQWERNIRFGWDADRIFRRRLWLLLVFGFMHACFFWFGDILHKYALLGFSLLYFRRKSCRSLLHWILLLIGLSVILQGVKSFYGKGLGLTNEPQQLDSLIMLVINVWQHGSFWEVLNLQRTGAAMLWVLSLGNGFSEFIQYEIMFLLGLIAGKLDLFKNLPVWKISLRWISIGILPFAITLKAWSSLVLLQIPPFSQIPNGAAEQWMISFSEFIGTFLLAVVYILFLCVFLHDKQGWFIRLISNTGRLGLTNYFMQTLLCMALFYGYGFGFSGKLSLMETWIPVFFIYLIQVVYSNIWLRYFSLGPMEMLWKKWIYKI